jgi:hypothetical protein
VIRRALRWLSLGVLTAVAAAQADAAPANERNVRWPDGSLRERWYVDDQEQKHGAHEVFDETGQRLERTAWQHGKRHGSHQVWRADGSPELADTWQADLRTGTCTTFHPGGAEADKGDLRDGKRVGKWTSKDATGQRLRQLEYRDGVLHGPIRVSDGGKVVSRQSWKQGELIELDGFAPFPIAQHTLLAELRAILATPTPVGADERAALRWQALQRLRVFRHLCRLPHVDMELVPAWNELCDAASEVCAANGALSHTPPCPPGFDAARHKQGYEGASHSNLARGRTLPFSVDSYMDDSDPSNIDRVGHRRWCLNPPMLKTGFGTAGDFHAMWSMDESGKAPKGIEAVLYPPPGHVPVDLFGSRHAFSITLLRSGQPKPEALRASIRPLDADWVPGEALADDVLHLGGGGIGTGPCVIFRKQGFVCAIGRRYLVELSTDGGKTDAFRYVVAFCEAVGGGDGGGARSR